MSSKQYRKMFDKSFTVPFAQKALKYASQFDQTIITGDTIDLLSHGSIDLMIKHIWEPYPDTIITLGNHEWARQMEGKVAETTPIEERYAWLERVWEPHHDMYYYSRLIGDKVLAIQMDNSLSKYWDSQIEPLKADLELAREKGYVVLLFQHCLLMTNNPAEKPVYYFYGDGRSNVSLNIGASQVGRNATGATKEIYDIITNNADVIKGVFCGHAHGDLYTEIIAKTSDGKDAVIPQYVLSHMASSAGGIALKITVK